MLFIYIYLNNWWYISKQSTHSALPYYTTRCVMCFLARWIQGFQNLIKFCFFYEFAILVGGNKFFGNLFESSFYWQPVLSRKFMMIIIWNWADFNKHKIGHWLPLATEIWLLLYEHLNTRIWIWIFHFIWIQSLFD